MTAEGNAIGHKIVYQFFLPGSTFNDTQITSLFRTCLSAADKAGSCAIVLPFPPGDFNIDKVWDLAHAVAQAVKDFLDAASDITIKRIEFVEPNHHYADTLTVVLKSVLKQVESDNLQVDSISNDAPTSDTTPSSGNTEEAQQPKDPAQWYQISDIIKRQKRSGKDLFLVKWENSNETSWVLRRNLSPAALKQFFAQNPTRRRRRH